MEAEYSKRVYQGVRVKHTVKDLLAEKRSRQTSGSRYSGRSASPSSLVQVPGSHALPAYYGVRRPFLSDSDFSAKPFSADVYSTTLAAKPLSCEAAAAAVGGYPSFIDSYYPDAFADYRGAAGPGSYLPSSALSSLLPGYGGESSHLFLRDSWDPEPVPQVEPLCADGLASVPPPMGSPDPPGSPSHYRSPSRAPYALHPLEDAHYHPLTPSPPACAANVPLGACSDPLRVEPGRSSEPGWGRTRRGRGPQLPAEGHCGSGPRVAVEARGPPPTLLGGHHGAPVPGGPRSSGLARLRRVRRGSSLAQPPAGERGSRPPLLKMAAALGPAPFPPTFTPFFCELKLKHMSE
ncbi:unnamed protein product [Tetraodon nigroviridis]|uniref:(spotted green pufferfish) hypothetical protein n=1 Tax=Tetraodon nigroviridis TaxID=99883 RepID=Q4RYQ2_TETNG|nr:unnamed protein product [Tetraodon nigroviridis]